MQYNLAGTSYKTSAADAGVSGGCPSNVCNGYELDNEIKFGFITSCCSAVNSLTITDNIIQLYINGAT